jgi:hypothetical protein
MFRLKSIYNINFGLIEQKMYFWTLQRVSGEKNSIIGIIFATKKISVELFWAAPYMHMLVLDKDALLHLELESSILAAA